MGRVLIPRDPISELWARVEQLERQVAAAGNTQRAVPAHTHPFGPESPAVAVQHLEPTGFTTTSTSFTTAGGPVCGIAFLAPDSGRVSIRTNGRVSNSTAGQFSAVGPVVKVGSVVGSGMLVLDVGYDSSLLSNTGDHRGSVSALLSGLVPGAAYNVQLWHAATGGTASINARSVIVTPER